MFRMMSWKMKLVLRNCITTSTISTMFHEVYLQVNQNGTDFLGIIIKPIYRND